MNAGTDRPDRDLESWHRLSAHDVAARLKVDPFTGLSASEAARRLAAHGPNRLPHGRRRSWLRTFVDQFRNFLVAVLIVAAALAAIVGDMKDLAVIGVVVMFNAVLGFIQEYRAESSLAALKRMLVTRASVRRDGVTFEVDAEDLAPGDVVIVEAGDRVPADGRWLLVADLHVDESAFTGESMPVTKNVAPMSDETAALADRRCMGFMNTTVTRGRGEIIVTGTGTDSEIGRLATMLSTSKTQPTPLQREIAHLGRQLTLVAGAAVALVVSLNAIRGVVVEDIVLNAVALAVAAIPEGLPAVLTVTLAVGTGELAKRRAIVKRLTSVETLGATSVICTDKTGTLTVNQMTARRVYVGGHSFSVSGEGSTTSGVIQSDDASTAAGLERFLAVCALCNDAICNGAEAVGDPTEAALVVLAARGGLDVPAERARRTRLFEVPFDSDAKYMATFHDDPASESVDVFVKGAPDVLLTLCERTADRDQTTVLDAAHRSALLKVNNDMGEIGLRVLAGASRRMSRAQWDACSDPRTLLRDLIFEGLVGLADPPRPEARQAIEQCQRAGIAVKMITGDHPVTACAIAAELGIPGEVMTGRRLDELARGDLAACVEQIGVFARVTPAHKVAIVAALQQRDHVVAMTGDGVNDAPALKLADIGVAMGVTGTEVAKEAAAMVLTDDNFATIVTAVEGGRTIYANIIKFVTFQLSTNIGAILTILAASLLDWPGDGWALFSPLSILWVNLIMDGPPAMALGVDPPGPGTMMQTPRSPDSRILTMRRLARLGAYGLIMTAGTLLAYRLSAGAGPVSDADATRATVVALTTFVFMQLFNLHNARFPDHSGFRRHAISNWRLWSASLVVIVLQAGAMSSDRAQRFFTGRDVAIQLRLRDWALAAAIASSIFLVDEIRKALGTNRAPPESLATATAGSITGAKGSIPRGPSSTRPLNSGPAGPAG